MQRLPINMDDMGRYQNNRDLTYDEFQYIVSIYSTNQDHYCDKNDKKNLRELELWFLQVIEPIPEDDEDLAAWLKRELSKKCGYTYNCSRHASRKFEVDFKKALDIYSAQLRETVRIFDQRTQTK